MRSLAPYLKNYKKESILAPFFKFLEVVFDLLVPVVIAQIIDVGIAGNDRGYIVQRFFILILMAAAGLAVSITAQFFAAKASVGFAAELRQAAFDHVQGLSYSELDRVGTDTLITRLTDDINQVQNGLNMGLRLLLRSPFIVIGAMIMAFTINVRCALIFAVAIPVLFLVVFVIMYLSIPLFRRVQGRLDVVTRLTRENLTGVRVIRAFCREQEAVEEFDQSNCALTKLNEFVGRLSALLNPATYVLINIATVILISTAGIQVNIGGLQQGEVVALYNYMAQMIIELIKLASLIITLNKAAACAGRVSAVLAVKSTMRYPEVEGAGAGPDGMVLTASGKAASDKITSCRTDFGGITSDGAISGGTASGKTLSGKTASGGAASGRTLSCRTASDGAASGKALSDKTTSGEAASGRTLSSRTASGGVAGEPAVIFDHVTFSYPDTGAPSLSDISFTAKKGETVGIIGGTGSGKTTLVNLIARFYDATKGTVLLDGQEADTCTKEALRKKIGVVPQRAALFKGSIRDNLKWGKEDATDEELWNALTIAQAREIVEGKDHKLDFALEQNGKNLSGGQRQRLTIARALVKQPEILILDDSASALDFATDAALRKALHSLDGTVTTFLVSQRAASIRQADLILVLDDGMLVGRGTHDSLVADCETYREIFFSQFPEERDAYEKSRNLSGTTDSPIKTAEVTL